MKDLDVIYDNTILITGEELFKDYFLLFVYTYPNKYLLKLEY
jgi:hypothetical protein